MAVTKTYQFTPFQRGEVYSAQADYRRFVTVDYNLETFVGIIGVGIINGWTVEAVNGLKVKILPGTGIIDGYASESPYAIKQRSSMVSGDREVEVDYSDIPEPYLTTEQKAIYVSAIQEYNPSYIPSTQIENAYVKVVVPEVITLTNNADNYIYASRKYENPYPALSDYPSTTLDKPNPNNFSTYSDYQIALSAYNDQQALVSAYEWDSSTSNHFTEVKFSVLTSSFVASPSQILVGKVTARNNNIYKIDTSNVQNLTGMYATIKSYVDSLLPNHLHSGKDNSPTKINLKTDIRNSTLISYDDKNKVATFRVLETNPTSTYLGHYHTYYVDTDGNGLTVDQMGSTVPHFHKISSFIVQTEETADGVVEDHIHTISTTYDSSWTSSSEYEVYMNGKIIGNQTSTNITVDSVSKSIAMKGIIGGTYKTFTSSFPFSIGSSSYNYTFTLETKSVYRFMLAMMSDFQNKYGSLFTTTESYDNHPFMFTLADGSIAGLTDLKNQSMVAESFLRKEGSTFVFTPTAARNVKVKLSVYKVVKGAESDNVKIEVLGNSEVTGKLKAENISYINASKISSGVLEIVRIPFISHVGRINENCHPISCPLTTTDGVKFQASISITNGNLNHYHSVSENNGAGSTNYTYIGDEAVLYATGGDGNQYYIAHSHSIKDGVIANSSSTGLTSWLSSFDSTITASYHTHTIAEIIPGDSKIIYSVNEDRNGNIYAGTSNGLVMIPVQLSYIFVINGDTYYEISDSLWGALQKAKADYESNQEVILDISHEVYDSQIAEAETVLVAQGNSTMLYGKSSPTGSQDVIMVKKIEAFEVPNFVYTSERETYEIGDDETVIELKIVDTATGQEFDINSSSAQKMMKDNPDAFKTIAVVQKNLNTTPIWDISLRSSTIDTITYDKITVAGANSVAINTNLQDSFYNHWQSPSTPISSSVFRKTIIDADSNVWAATDKGLMVARSYNHQQVFDSVSQPGLDSSITDILEGEYWVDVNPTLNAPVIYCASSKYIYKTTNSGKTWTQLFNMGNKVARIIRDYKKDITTSSLTPAPHTHQFLVDKDGNGTLSYSESHTHTVTNWQISTSFSHTHTIVTTIYAIGSQREIYKSINNGSSWIFVGSIPLGEYSDIIAFNDNLFIGKTDGVYKFNDNKWSNVFSKTAYSFSFNFDMSSFFVGGYNSIFDYNSGLFDSIYQFDGFPQPILFVNGNKKYFGYAYSNQSKSMFLKEISLSSNKVSAFINFDKWIAENGAWNKNTKYDIFIDDYLALSTKKNIDNSSVMLNGPFKIYPELGFLDFGATGTVSKDIKINSSVVTMDSSTNSFYTGDKILIRSTKTLPAEPKDPGYTDPLQYASYINSVKAYQEEKLRIENMFYYTTVSFVNGNNLYFENNCEKLIEAPSEIVKIANLDGSSVILMNIYKSMLYNCGINTHEELEDIFSIESDFRPRQFNNSFLSNILQLTQAVRYVYPEINSTMKQSNFYDFKYSRNPLSPYYVEKYVDELSSGIYNKGIFADEYSSKGSKNINCILVGTDNFENITFAGTDIGLFKTDTGFENNWTYMFEMSYPVYSLKIFGNSILLAATGNGVYITEDLKTWTLQSNDSILFPAFSMSYRWSDSNIITIPSHTCTMYNSESDSLGVIQASSDIYGYLLPNRSIKVDITSDPGNVKNGTYTIKDVTANKITLTSSFLGDTSTESGVIIQMASWWESFNGETNVGNSNITNTLLVGGANKIAVNTSPNSFLWTGASISTGVSNFNVVKLLPLSTGVILAAAPGNNSNKHQNYLLRCINLGTYWDALMTMSAVTGTIKSIDNIQIQPSITQLGHTELIVNFDSLEGTLSSNGEFDKRQVSFFSNKSSTPICTGYIIGNEIIDNNYLYVYGRSAYDSITNSIKNNETVTFSIFPVQINSIVESQGKSVFYGTNAGLYYDLDTVSLHKVVEGSIYNIGVEGNITQIDLYGTIKNVERNTSTNNVRVFLNVSNSIVKNELTGKKIYLTNQNNVSYSILGNETKSDNNEVAVDIDATFDISWSALIGNEVTIIGTNSIIYLNTKRVIKKDEFSGGTFTVTSDENNNYGKTYSIISNTENYIEVEAISPSSSDGVINGQSISLIKSNLELTVVFNRPVKNNEFINFKMDILNSTSNPIKNDIVVHSNTQNKITLNYSEYLIDAASFSLKGISFEPVQSFNNKKTTIEDDHYHGTEMVGVNVSGDISSFSNVGSSTVTINVKNTNNFSNPIVQLRGDLFSDATIRFFNKSNLSSEFLTKVISHDSSSITVKSMIGTEWDFETYNLIKISEDWSWEIDATNYGYTYGISYNDFMCEHQNIIGNINKGDETISIKSTSGIIVGDKIRIVGGTNVNEINYVKSILGGTSIELSSSANNVYRIQNNSHIEVLRDSFSNIHTHQIRNNMVETLIIEDYIAKGYQLRHSHRSIPLLETVSGLEKIQSKIVSAGSDSKIYKSTNNGQTWSSLPDLNSYSGNGDEITGVSTISAYGSKIIIGTTNGNIFKG